MIVSDLFELEVLTYLFRTPERMGYFLTQIQAEHFKDPVLSGIWVLFQEQFESYRELNQVALIEAVGGRTNPGSGQLFAPDEMPRVADFLAIITADHAVLAEWVDDGLCDWLSKRRVDLYHAANMEAILDGDHDKVHANYRQLIAEQALATEDEEEDFFLTMDKIAASVTEDYSRRISTGLTSFNAILGGGLFRGEFGIFWGPPEIGKSMMTVQVGVSAIEGGARVLHLSTEMDKRQVEQRYVARFTQISKNDLGLPVNEEMVRAWQEKYGGGHVGMLTVKHLSQGTTVNDLWSIIVKGSMEDKPYHLVIIDYVDKIHYDGSKDTPDWLRLEKVFEQLQDLCKVDGATGTDTCIFAITHANESVNKKAFAGHESLVRAKTAKSKVVDFSIFMGATPKDRLAGRVILSCQKLRNREPEIKSCALLTHYSTSQFTDDDTWTRAKEWQ